MTTARGTFVVQMAPGPQELDGAVARFELAKTFAGDLRGEGRGLMVSAGDPASGEAGYVAVEVVRGTLGGREGGFALQQLGSMTGGHHELRYEVVPGSGTGQLAGLTGSLELTVDDDGVHHYALEHRL